MGPHVRVLNMPSQPTTHSVPRLGLANSCNHTHLALLCSAHKLRKSFTILSTFRGMGGWGVEKDQKMKNE